MVERARHGDAGMIRELLTRLVGRPDGGPDPDRLDEREAVAEESRLRSQRRAREARPRPYDLPLDR